MLLVYVKLMVPHQLWYYNYIPAIHLAVPLTFSKRVSLQTVPIFQSWLQMQLRLNLQQLKMMVINKCCDKLHCILHLLLPLFLKFEVGT
jgi:hypothetical protein